MAEGSSEDSQIPEEIKKFVRAVLLSKIGGVPLERFASDFQKLAGYPIHYKEFGFTSLRGLLEAMPSVVRFNYSDEASKWMLYGIGDPNTYMSSAAKKAQFSKPGDGTKETPRKRNRKKFPKSNGAKRDTCNSPVNQQRRSNQTSRADVSEGDRLNNNKGDNAGPRAKTEDKKGEDGELRVSRSSRGLYSVCVFHKGGPGESKYKLMQEICELFATQGDVIEKSCVKSLMFFRFMTEDEAVSVIKVYNGRCLSDGKEIRVTPATEKMPSNRNQSAKQSDGSPSWDQQREQQQHMLEQVHLQHQIRQTEQQLLAQQQVLEQYVRQPEAYPYLENYAGVPEPYSGRHREQFFDGHQDNGFENGHDPASKVEICVFNINKSIAKEDLMSHFWEFNPLHVRIRSKQVERNTRWFAFVAFACLGDAQNAEANLKNSTVKDCRIKMEIAKTKQHNPRSPNEQARLQKTKEPNQKARSESRGPPPSCRSEDDSIDSISGEMVVSDVSDGDQPPPRIGDKVPVIDDSPYSRITHHVTDDTQSSVSSSPVSGLQKGGMSFGRGRGSLLGQMSPSFGRGLAQLNNGTEKKKKLRPSLADLADKLHEL